MLSYLVCVATLQVEKKLAARLQAGLQAWTTALIGQQQKDEDIDIPMDTDTPEKPTHKPGGDPKVSVLTGGGGDRSGEG